MRLLAFWIDIEVICRQFIEDMHIQIRSLSNARKSIGCEPRIRCCKMVPAKI